MFLFALVVLSMTSVSLIPIFMTCHGFEVASIYIHPVIRSPVLISAGTGQDPEVVNSTNDAGYTALHHAARHGSRELIEILLKANADRMIENNAGETPYMVAQRFQQYEAERLLLNIEQQHGNILLVAHLFENCGLV